MDFEEKQQCGENDDRCFHSLVTSINLKRLKKKFTSLQCKFHGNLRRNHVCLGCGATFCGACKFRHYITEKHAAYMSIRFPNDPYFLRQFPFCIACILPKPLPKCPETFHAIEIVRYSIAKLSNPNQNQMLCHETANVENNTIIYNPFHKQVTNKKHSMRDDKMLSQYYQLNNQFRHSCEQLDEVKESNFKLRNRIKTLRNENIEFRSTIITLREELINERNYKLELQDEIRKLVQDIHSNVKVQTETNNNNHKNQENVETHFSGVHEDNKETETQDETKKFLLTLPDIKQIIEILKENIEQIKETYEYGVGININEEMIKFYQRTKQNGDNFPPVENIQSFAVTTMKLKQKNQVEMDLNCTTYNDFTNKQTRDEKMLQNAKINIQKNKIKIEQLYQEINNYTGVKKDLITKVEQNKSWLVDCEEQIKRKQINLKHLQDVDEQLKSYQIYKKMWDENLRLLWNHITCQISVIELEWFKWNRDNILVWLIHLCIKSNITIEENKLRLISSSLKNGKGLTQLNPLFLSVFDLDTRWANIVIEELKKLKIMESDCIDKND